MASLVLNRNELSEGPAPAVLRALRSITASELRLYLPGYYSSRLAPFLSKRFKLPVERVLLYYGLEDFFRLTFGRLSGQTILVNELHYYDYDERAAVAGARLVTFRMQRGTEAFSFDIDDCLRKIRQHKPAAVLLTSPNNPTGNILMPTEFETIARAAPRRTLVMLDEAYIGFQRRYDQKAFLRIVRRRPNVILLRTFSKDYGLAGLRLGYALCGRDVVRRLRESSRTLGFSRVHETLAMAALRSESYRRHVVARTIARREQFIRAINRTSSLKAFVSEANFVLMKARNRSWLRQLDRRQRTLPVVLGKTYGDRYLRVSIGPSANVEQFIRLAKKLDA